TSKYRLLSLAAIVDVFETANRFLREEGKSELFEISFVGAAETKMIPDSLQHIAYLPMGSGQSYDLIFIPAFGSVDLVQTLEDNRCFIPWLHEQYAQGATLASNCTGAFLLAASGL